VQDRNRNNIRSVDSKDLRVSFKLNQDKNPCKDVNNKGSQDVISNSSQSKDRDLFTKDSKEKDKEISLEKDFKDLIKGYAANTDEGIVRN